MKLFKRKIKEVTLNSPISGEIMSLADVPDEVFATGAMGEGLAINPQNGEVYAPLDGTISAVFPTGHAIGIKSANGADILIHIGMDTVNLNGKGFETLVKKDDTVQAGQLITRFDLNMIKDAGYSVVTPIVITNTSDFKKINFLETNAKNVKVNTPIISIE